MSSFRVEGIWRGYCVTYVVNGDPRTVYTQNGVRGTAYVQVQIDDDRTTTVWRDDTLVPLQRTMRADAPVDLAEEEPSLLAYAERELQLFYGTARGGAFDARNQQIQRDVLALVALFAEQGHSGSSAETVLALFRTVAAWLPLLPLTGEPDEWETIEEVEGVELNRRMPSVARDETGAYVIGHFVFEEPNGVRFTAGSASSLPITAWPFRPPRRPVIVKMPVCVDTPLVDGQEGHCVPFTRAEWLARFAAEQRGAS